uniref:Apple domain-containing protein n=1 Tax=Heterorhabditis bacteriophora TaxID=37862 RepID=A0A1I7X146_HETBA
MFLDTIIDNMGSALWVFSRSMMVIYCLSICTSFNNQCCKTLYGKNNILISLESMIHEYIPSTIITTLRRPEVCYAHVIGDVLIAFYFRELLVTDYYVAIKIGYKIGGARKGRYNILIFTGREARQMDTLSTPGPSHVPYSPDLPTGRIYMQTTAPIPTAFRVLYPIILLFSVISPGESSGRCFNTEKGLSIDGGDYRRIRNIDHRGCALECRDDFSCLAYEWDESKELCFLKSRSLNGELRKKEETLIGFCLDEDDEIRDRFRDHIVTGPEVAIMEDVDGDDCRGLCAGQPETAIYTWTPKDQDDDEAVIGTCIRLSVAIIPIIVREEQVQEVFSCSDETNSESNRTFIARYMSDVLKEKQAIQAGKQRCVMARHPRDSGK